MIKIDYPVHEFRMKKENGREMIFDEIRKSWLKLTPEEWVRQNFLRFLIHVKNYPSALVALEKRIQVGEMMKRFDILVYNTHHEPWMMVECTSMDVTLKEEVLNQVLRYNIAVPVRFLVITNGTSCMVFEKIERQLAPLDLFPDFMDE
jgi:hypothetical protein